MNIKKPFMRKTLNKTEKAFLFMMNDFENKRTFTCFSHTCNKCSLKISINHWETNKWHYFICFSARG